KEFCDVTRVNSAAGVGDRGFDESLGGHLEIDGDAAAWWRELDRVPDEIPKNLFQFVVISLHRWKPIRMQDLQGNRFFGRDSPQTVGDEESGVFDGYRCKPEHVLLRAKARPVEQLIDDSGEAIDIMSDASEVGQLLFAYRPCHTVAHIVCEAADHGHGGAQFMRRD